MIKTAKYTSCLLLANNIIKKKNIHLSRIKNKKEIQIKDISKISVIIPFYNEELVIKKTLNKITSIGIKGEILLINNCSTDNSIRIIEEFIYEYYK